MARSSESVPSQAVAFEPRIDSIYCNLTHDFYLEIDTISWVGFRTFKGIVCAHLLHHVLFVSSVVGARIFLLPILASWLSLPTSGALLEAILLLPSTSSAAFFLGISKAVALPMGRSGFGKVLRRLLDPIKILRAILIYGGHTINLFVKFCFCMSFFFLFYIFISGFWSWRI